MSFRELFEQKPREISGGFGTIALSVMERHNYKLVKQIDSDRLMYTRPRYDGEALDHIIGTMFFNDREQYVIGKDCEITHYTENNITVIVGVTFHRLLSHPERGDENFKLILAELRKTHPVDLGCFPYYEHKGF